MKLPALRIDTHPAAATVTAAASSAASTGDPEPGPPPRTVAGLAVPYETEALIGGRWVTFAAESITFPAGQPLLLGHDPNQPVGVLAEATQAPEGVHTAHRIDPTPIGDMALAQATSGSRRGLSVGVEVDRYEASDEDPDRIRVLEGRAVETSLVALAAYPTAGVEQVAATHTLEDAVSEQDTHPQQLPDMADVMADRIMEKLRAEDARPRLIVAEPDAPRMRLGEYVTSWVRAQRGDRDAQQRLDAALTRETVGSEPGVIPIAYVSQIVDSLGAARPLFDGFSKAELPPGGMLIRRPQITVRPDGQWLADDTVGMPSGPLTIGNMDTPVEQWAWGGSASVALVERSMPSYVEESFAQMLKAYYRDVEAKLAGNLPTAASTATTIGGAVAEYTAAYREAPNLIIAGGAAYGHILDSIGLLRFASGSADAQGQATIYGLRVVVSPDVTPADLWVTSSDFLENRESSPLRLTVVDVGGLSMEIGLTAFFASTQTRQSVAGPPAVNGAVHVAGYTPTAAVAGSGPTSSRK